MPKRGLGKGLETLFQSSAEEEAENPDIISVRITQIEPNKNQPRKNFDSEKAEALAESIKEHGLIQPVILTQGKNGMYTIVAGERRWRAAKKAGLKELPAVVRSYSAEETAEIALIENLQREDLNPLEEAAGYRKLMDDFNLTQDAVSRKIGKSRSSVANSLRLLTLEKEITEMISDGRISEGHARAILALETKEERLALAKKIFENNLNVRQAEEAVKSVKKSGQPKKEVTRANDAEIKHTEEAIASVLGTKVSLKPGRKRGKIEIEYYGNKDLDRILALINVNI